MELKYRGETVTYNTESGVKRARLLRLPHHLCPCSKKSQQTSTQAYALLQMAQNAGIETSFAHYGYSFPFYYDNTVRQACEDQPRVELGLPNYPVFLDTRRHCIPGVQTGLGRVAANFKHYKTPETDAIDLTQWVCMGSLVTDGEPETDRSVMTVKVTGTATLETCCDDQLFTFDRAIIGVREDGANTTITEKRRLKGRDPYEMAVLWPRGDEEGSKVHPRYCTQLGVVLRSKSRAQSTVHVLLDRPRSMICRKHSDAWNSWSHDKTD